MTRFLAAVPALLVLIATSPIQAGQKGAMARIPPDTPNTGAGVKISETSRAVTSIQGNALDSANTQLANAVVRLRDARFGRIVDTRH